MDVWSSLWPVLALIAGGAVICLAIVKRRGKPHGTLRVDPLADWFVDEQDRQEDPGE